MKLLKYFHKDSEHISMNDSALIYDVLQIDGLLRDNVVSLFPYFKLQKTDDLLAFLRPNLLCSLLKKQGVPEDVAGEVMVDSNRIYRKLSFNTFIKSDKINDQNAVNELLSKIVSDFNTLKETYGDTLKDIHLESLMCFMQLQLQRGRSNFFSDVLQLEPKFKYPKHWDVDSIFRIESAYMDCDVPLMNIYISKCVDPSALYELMQSKEQLESYMEETLIYKMKLTKALIEKIKTFPYTENPTETNKIYYDVNEIIKEHDLKPGSRIRFKSRPSFSMLELHVDECIVDVYPLNISETSCNATMFTLSGDLTDYSLEFQFLTSLELELNNVTMTGRISCSDELFITVNGHCSINNLKTVGRTKGAACISTLSNGQLAIVEGDDEDNSLTLTNLYKYGVCIGNSGKLSTRGDKWTPGRKIMSRTFAYIRCNLQCNNQANEGEGEVLNIGSYGYDFNPDLVSLYYGYTINGMSELPALTCELNGAIKDDRYERVIRYTEPAIYRKSQQDIPTNSSIKSF